MNILKDPYVEELHHIREAYAKKFNFDVDEMVKDLKKMEQRHKGRFVTAKRKAKRAAY